jgi:hypothetical protein
LENHTHTHERIAFVTTLQLIAQSHLLTASFGALVQSSTHALPQAAPTTIGDIADRIKGAIDTILNYFLPIGLALCALYYAWGGLLYITAGSSPILVQKARTTWWHATVGVVGVILATPLVNTVEGFFK